MLYIHWAGISLVKTLTFCRQKKDGKQWERAENEFSFTKLTQELQSLESDRAAACEAHLSYIHILCREDCTVFSTVNWLQVKSLYLSLTRQWAFKWLQKHKDFFKWLQWSEKSPVWKCPVWIHMASPHSSQERSSCFLSCSVMHGPSCPRWAELSEPVQLGWS